MQEHTLERPNLTYMGQLTTTQDLDFERKFAVLLKNEFTSDLGMYLYHIGINEPRAASEYVHKLKYKFSMLGMEKTFEFAEHHKERLQLGDMSLDGKFKKILKKVALFLETI